MGPLYGLILFGVAFFGFMVAVGVVQAYRKKEKAYYISAMVSFLLFLFSLVIILNQFILALILFIVLIAAIPILSVVGLPRIREAMRRDLVKQAQEVDPSAPLAVRDFLTWEGWFKLTYRWGTRKTMCLYSVFMMGIGGAVFFTLSILGALSIVLAAVITILVGIVSPIFFHRQIGKALREAL
jgi:hypothetical protein